MLVHVDGVDEGFAPDVDKGRWEVAKANLVVVNWKNKWQATVFSRCN